MIGLLAKIFIKDSSNTSSPAVRQAYGVLCGAAGIFFNIVLSAAKFIAGLLSGSVAITADAFNNLSDAGSSVVSLIGFKLSGQKPDLRHPFGHGRIEYVSGFLVSIIILIMGFELGKTSVEKIINPTEVTFSVASVVILALSVAVKFYMFYYNRRISRKIASEAMNATATDSLSDCAATSAVLISMIIGRAFSINIDGWCGVAVAVFILYSGIKSAMETINPLLGQPPEKELVQQISDIVTSYDEVRGIHDLIIHNYGPGRMMVSLHAEVSSNADLLHTHDTIDNIEHKLATELGCDAVIHMDPVATDDELTTETRRKVSELVKALDHAITIHDFRMVVGHTHTNLIFDVVVPFNFRLSDEEIKKEIERLVTVIDKNYRAVINVDKSYTG